MIITSLRCYWPRPSSLWSLVIVLIVFHSFFVAAASAQDEPDLIDAAEESAPADEQPEKSSIVEVIQITANRRSEDLQRAAVSVTALKASFIEDVGLTDFSDIQKFTPNLQIISGGDTRSTSIKIRGIGSIGSNAGIDPSVGVFIDGVYQGRAGMSVLDLMDISSIEVLKGPQGTLYGKNTAAGALKVTSRIPDYDPASQYEYVTGNYESDEARFTANIPLIEDKLATRLTGYWVDRDGYETNEAPIHSGDDINQTTRWGLRNSTLWDVTDDIRVLIRGDYAEVDERCCAADVWRYGRAGDVVLPTSAEQLALLKGITLQPAVKGDRKVTADQNPDNQVEVGGVSVEVTADSWDHTLSLLTAYRSYQSDSFLDADFSELDVIRFDADVELDQVSAELRAVSPRFKYVDYVTGLYFFYSKLDTVDALGFQDDAFPLFVDSINTGTNEHTTTSAAGYGDANFNLSEFWGDEPNITITGGIRIGWEQKEHVGSQISTGPLKDSGLETAVSGPDSFSDQSKGDNYITGRVIAKWEFVIPWKHAGNMMLYGSYSTGYKSAGFNQLRTQGGGTDSSVLYFGPEDSESFEGGIRTAWFDRMITFNVTGYYTGYKDFQAQVFDGFGIRVLNAGNFETYGFEADLTLAPLEGWLTLFSAGYTKTNYKRFLDGPCVQGSPIVCTQDLKGKRLDGTPLWNLNLFSAYERGLPDLGLFGTNLEINWLLMLDYNYQSARNLNASLDPFLRVSPTHTLGLRAGLRHPDLRWEVTAWIKNLTDEDVWAIGFDVPTMGGYAAFSLPPRTYGLTLRLRI